MWSMWDANQWFNVIEFHHQLQNMFFFETCSLQNLGEWLKHVQTPAIKMVPWLGLSTWEAEWMVVSNRWEQWYNDQDQREVTLGPLSLVSINYTGSNQKGPQEEAYLTNSSKGKYQKGKQTGHVGLLGEQRFCPFSHNSKKWDSWPMWDCQANCPLKVGFQRFQLWHNCGAVDSPASSFGLT